MAANSHRVGSSYGGAASYRSRYVFILMCVFEFIISVQLIVCDGYCRDGLSTRPVGASEEIQLRIDPMDLDEEITGLHRQVRRLKHVCISHHFLISYFIYSFCAYYFFSFVGHV